MKSLYMEHTTIEVNKTIAEICASLQAAGAISIETRFKDLRICGLFWSMEFNGRRVSFQMPARIDPVFAILRKRRGRMTESDARRLQAQAERFAWRQLLRWVQAQVSLIETGMVKPPEPFMAYAQRADGVTMFEAFTNTLALPAGREG